MYSKKAYIRAVASYLPKKVLTNQDLEKMVSTSDAWIVSRTGMKERRMAAKDEFASDMGVKASLNALNSIQMKGDAIDAIIVMTMTPDYPFPSTACLIQDQIGAKQAFAFDIVAACSGFIYGLQIAKSFIESGSYKNVLLVASEKLSSIIDYEDRNTCVLFGDGAAAVIVSHEGPGLCLRESSLGSDGSQALLLYMPGGGCRHPSSSFTVQEKMHFLKMDGKEVFKNAVRCMEASALETIQKAGLEGSDIAFLIPHQANIRIIDSIAKRCGINEEKIIKTVDRFGNTSASSIGIALDELVTKRGIKDRENLLLIAFGAGLTYGSMLLTCEGEFVK